MEFFKYASNFYLRFALNNQKMLQDIHLSSKQDIKHTNRYHKILKHFKKGTMFVCLMQNILETFCILNLDLFTGSRNIRKECFYKEN